MINEDIKQIVEKEYNLRICSTEKIKNVYKIITDKEVFALKVIKYNLQHFLFILSAIKHLQKNKFKKTPDIIKNIHHKDYIKLFNYYAYLNPWIDSKQCNYNNKENIKIATIKLGQLHKKSRGFKVTSQMQPRVGWGQWVENFKKKKWDIKKFKEIIIRKKQKTLFDEMYLKSIPEEIERIDTAKEHLCESNYLEYMNDEVKLKGFCHHDYAHHNILLESNGSVNIIDFDYCILDTHLHDLSSIIIRIMKNGKWNINNSIKILDWYNSVYPIRKNDFKIMSAFIEFPQAFWQIGIQYYIEKQPWREEFFINKIKKIYKDKDKRQKFVNEFRVIRY